MHRVLVAVVAIASLTTSFFAVLPATEARAAETPWVNDLAYGSAGGGFYWDTASGQVWTAERHWHPFSPQTPRVVAPLWGDHLSYGSAGGGFYWDPISNQVWTAERGWHYFSPQPGGRPAPPTPPPTVPPVQPGGLSIDFLDGKAIVVGDDGEFLGRFSSSRYDSDSICNKYGDHGSRYSSDSIVRERDSPSETHRCSNDCADVRAPARCPGTRGRPNASIF